MSKLKTIFQFNSQNPPPVGTRFYVENVGFEGVVLENNEVNVVKTRYTSYEPLPYPIPFNSAWFIRYLMPDGANNYSTLDWDEELWNGDLNCLHIVKEASGGGRKCIRCGGWFCY